MELSALDLVHIRNAFNQSGYVYDFSNATFSDFTIQSVGESIQNKYNSSKGHSLDLYFADKTVDIKKKIKLLSDLIDYDEIYTAKSGYAFWQSDSNEVKTHNRALDKCREILKRLSGVAITTETDEIQEKGLKELVQEAQSYFEKDKKVATEKMWDALERLKTYYFSSLNDKKKSAEKIVNDMSHNDSNYIDLFNEEFKKLTDIGNQYRIRHHETNKIEIIDDNYYVYFYYRCLSLIDLAKKYLV